MEKVIAVVVLRDGDEAAEQPHDRVLLGMDLLKEALVDTIGKVSLLEYLTIVVIVLTMGIFDFVIGIVVGIILACVFFVVTTSKKSAIRARYSGAVAKSKVSTRIPGTSCLGSGAPR